jgi:hypothetical protein
VSNFDRNIDRYALAAVSRTPAGYCVRLKSDFYGRACVKFDTIAKTPFIQSSGNLIASAAIKTVAEWAAECAAFAIAINANLI